MNLYCKNNFWFLHVIIFYLIIKFTMQIFNLFFILNSKCQRHSHYSIQFDFWISSYCRHSTKMSLKFTFTVICILFIQIQAKIARDVVEEKQKLSKEEREARKKKLHCIKNLSNLGLLYLYWNINIRSILILLGQFGIFTVLSFPNR